MAVKAETATVYIGGGRRWLTLRTAARKEAHAKIIERHGCDCESGDHETPPVYCGWHPGGGVKEYETRLRRLSKIYIKAAKAAKEPK